MRRDSIHFEAPQVREGLTLTLRVAYEAAKVCCLCTDMLLLSLMCFKISILLHRLKAGPRMSAHDV